MTDLEQIKQRVAQWKQLRASATDGTAQDGIAGCCNIVTFDGDDIRGVCFAHGGDKAFIMHAYNTDLAADCEALVAEVERMQPFYELGKLFEGIAERFSEELPDDKTEAFIEVWSRERKECERLRTQNARLRAERNQLQQELAARPDR